MTDFTKAKEIAKRAVFALSPSAALVSADLPMDTLTALVRAGVHNLDEIRDWPIERLAGIRGLGKATLPALLVALGRPWETADPATVEMACDRAREALYIARAAVETGDPLAWLNRRREYQARSDARKSARKAAEKAGTAPRRRARRGAHRRGYTPPA